MLEAALKYFAGLASRAEQAQEVEIDDARRKVFIIGNEFREFAVAHEPREHVAETLEDLTSLAKWFAEEEGYGNPVVWFNHQKVWIVIDDDAHRIETVELKLPPSDVFDRLDEIGDKKPKFDQKQFIRLLRVELAGTLDPVLLLEKVRRLKFENGVRTESTIVRAQESLGRNIVSKVESDGEIPEEVTLQVPVFKSPGPVDRHPLRCSVEVDPAEGTFRLLPLPDEIERVTQRAVDLIGATLRAGLPAEVPAYQGTP